MVPAYGQSRGLGTEGSQSQLIHLWLCLPLGDVLKQLINTVTYGLVD